VVARGGDGVGFVAGPDAVSAVDFPLAEGADGRCEGATTGGEAETSAVLAKAGALAAAGGTNAGLACVTTAAGSPSQPESSSSAEGTATSGAEPGERESEASPMSIKVPPTANVESSNIDCAPNTAAASGRLLEGEDPSAETSGTLPRRGAREAQPELEKR